MKINPVYNRIIAEAINEDKEVKVGLIVMPGRQKPYCKAKVISVGPGIWQNGKRIEMDIKVGDIIYYNPAVTAGMILEDDDKGVAKTLLFTDNDVIGYERDEV